MDRLNSRAVIAEYALALEQNTGANWIDMISNRFSSDQESEEYAWLGMPPVMREWLGQRKPKKLGDYGFTVTNDEYESTIEILLKHLRRANGDQIRARIAEHVQRSNAHWASLLSTLIINGATGVAYDGQYFFDTDHVVGDSGSQSNDITVDISTPPTAVHGVVTAPSPAEIGQSIIKGIDQICGLSDDQGEPMNEEASEFLVMLPTSLYTPASSWLRRPPATEEEEQASDKMIKIVANTRLNSSFTDKFAVFRTDSPVKPLIRQEEVGVEVSAKAEGSDFEFDNNAHQYGLHASRAVAYGRWEQACLVQMT